MTHLSSFLKAFLLAIVRGRNFTKTKTGGTNNENLTLNVIEMANDDIWNPFWYEMGRIARNWFASHAFTKENKTLHEIGSGSSSLALAAFMSESSDPLL
ncbi:hypothetical protein [Alteromonas sp. S015]|uniref:hypothetical protein n=1 Tax=Alteromonas sp. S015 TaxID=3117401 RepID=UPI002FE2F43B